MSGLILKPEVVASIPLTFSCHDI